MGKKSFSERFLSLVWIFVAILFLVFGLFYVLALHPGNISGASIKNNPFPFYPSLITFEAQHEKITIEDFRKSISCRACHIITFKEWDGSIHSKAFDDPLFLAMWGLGSQETNGKIDKFCLGCHTPIGLITSDVTGLEDVPKAEMISKGGVQCDFCHTVIGTNYRATAISYPHNASLIVKPGDVKWGPLEDSNSTFHESEFSRLHMSSEFCGCCHNIFLFDSGIQIVKTYNEWEASVYAEKGIQCQDCHMMPVDLANKAADNLKTFKNPGRAAIIGGRERETIHVHKFVGGGLIIEKDLKYIPKDREMEKRLKSAARLDITVIPSQQPNGGYILRTTVYNERAGHNIPTGMPGLRELWLEVIVLDKAGKELYRSGGLDKEGRIPENVKYIGVRGIDSAGNFTYYPWAIVSFGSDTSIPPKESRVFEFELKIKEDTLWPITVKAVLHYRAIPPVLLKTLLPDFQLDIPVIDMSIKEVSISAP